MADSLRSKTILFAGGVLVAVVFVFGTITSSQLFSIFGKLQEFLLEEQVARFILGVQKLGELKVLMIREYAEWDETYEFMESRDENYINDYYIPGSNTTGEDVAVFFDEDRKPILTKWLKKTEGADIPLSEKAQRSIVEGGLLGNEHTLGFSVEDGRPMILAAGPILRNNQSGPPRGWLVYGRWLTPEVVDMGASLAGLKARDIRVLDELPRGAHGGLPSQSALTVIGITPRFNIFSRGPSFTGAEIYLPSLDGGKYLVIDVDIRVQVLEAAEKARDYIVLLSIVAGVFLIALPLLVFEWAVLRKTAWLDRSIQELSGNPSAFRLLDVRGNDEFARLARSVNSLIQSEQAAVKKLRESESRFRGAMEYSAIGMGLIGLDGSWLEANAALCQFLGYSAEELKDVNFLQIADAEELAARDCPLPDLLAGKIHSCLVESHYVRKGGQRVWGLLSAAVVRDEAGNPMYLVAQIKDIEERKQAEDALRQAESNSKAIFEAIGDPIFVHGFEDSGLPGNFVYVNASACELLGRKREDLLKMGPHMIDDLPLEQAATASAAIVTKGAATFETTLIGVNGRRIPVEINARLVELSGRKLCISAARSLAARKEIEDELRRAKDAAESANRAKSEFLATMSHEIRTPLHGVIGFTSLLREENLPADQRMEFIEGIEDSGKTLLALVSDVLDFSRIEAGRLVLNEQPVELMREISRICRATSLLAREKGVSFRFEIDASLPGRINADILRIEQILGNLINNALKFTSDGEVLFQARKGASDKPGETELVFTVSDTGIGISPGQLEKLFQPFSQADSSLSRRYGGSGLGLVIVKRLCELMGGSISVRSSEGKGSTFTATVIAKTPADAEVPRAAPAAPQPANPPLPQGLKALVAEDNRLNQKLVTRMLEKRGCIVRLVSNGREAIAAIKREKFDIVFMDVSMPEMDGLEATREIRRMEIANHGARTRIIALTAGISEQERGACLDAGMDGFLGKPLDSHRLDASLAAAAAS